MQELPYISIKQWRIMSLLLYVKSMITNFLDLLNMAASKKSKFKLFLDLAGPK